jgi:transcriptional regulator with XRE-family HTH domain
MTLRQRIKFTRILYGLTQGNVASALGVTKQYISMVENNNGGVRCSEERLEMILNTIYKIGESKKIGQMEECIKECNKVSKEMKEQNKVNIE